MSRSRCRPRNMLGFCENVNQGGSCAEPAVQRAETLFFLAVRSVSAGLAQSTTQPDRLLSRIALRRLLKNIYATDKYVVSCEFSADYVRRGFRVSSLGTRSRRVWQARVLPLEQPQPLSWRLLPVFVLVFLPPLVHTYPEENILLVSLLLCKVNSWDALPSFSSLLDKPWSQVSSPLPPGINKPSLFFPAHRVCSASPLLVDFHQRFANSRARIFGDGVFAPSCAVKHTARDGECFLDPCRVVHGLEYYPIRQNTLVLCVRTICFVCACSALYEHALFVGACNTHALFCMRMICLVCARYVYHAHGLYCMYIDVYPRGTSRRPGGPTHAYSCRTSCFS